MKNIILLFVITLIFQSCYAPYETTNYSTYKTDSTKTSKYFFVKYDYALINKSDTSSLLFFTDDKVSVKFNISKESINFIMNNKTDEVMRIIWDEASIVQYGKSHKVMHSGVKYIDRNNLQPPTTIPPLASVDDLALPCDNISYNSGWSTKDFFPSNNLYGDYEYWTKDMAMNLKGEVFSLYLPIKYQDKTIDYNFKFIITTVKEGL